MPKKQQEECHHCKWGRTPKPNDEGVLFHAVKESNGLDYDMYYYPCKNQPKEAMAAYRKVTADAIKKLIKNQRETINILKGYLEQVERTKDASSIQRALEEARNVARSY